MQEPERATRSLALASRAAECGLAARPGAAQGAVADANGDPSTNGQAHGRALLWRLPSRDRQLQSFNCYPWGMVIFARLGVLSNIEAAIARS